MDFAGNLFSTGTLAQILVGLSRTTILFIVSSGMSLILGVLRIPNVAHGSLYMIGAFAAWTVIQFLGGGLFAFLAAMIVAPLIVAAVGFVLERGFFSYLYEREHLMLLLLTFAFMLILGDLVKIVWGPEYRSVTVPAFFQGSAEIFGLTQSLGILVWPQFGIAFPYLAVVAVLVARPRGLLRSTW